MFTRTLLACAFAMSCFMGLQANDQLSAAPSVELCEKNKDNSSLLAGCCKGKCNKKRKGSKKKNRSSELACRGKKKKEIIDPAPLFECKDC